MWWNSAYTSNFNFLTIISRTSYNLPIISNVLVFTSSNSSKTKMIIWHQLTKLLFWFVSGQRCSDESINIWECRTDGKEESWEEGDGIRARSEPWQWWWQASKLQSGSICSFKTLWWLDHAPYQACSSWVPPLPPGLKLKPVLTIVLDLHIFFVI